MHLRSISMKGFKSFPHRTKLDFTPGVSVVVGPNGSGKSNITDAVLWALGEQSPLAVRGQVMKDVIFAGGHGVAGSGAAEVEVVIDNSDGRLDTEFSEISIVRRLARDGEGEYRLNGARCRLVDVIEVLSDSGLGKEMHSVVSQGKVEQIVMSRPRERRLLIEEAAGLGKHRKRRRRAQLKLDRTQDNLGRALDVEREARSRLRPLKRQAEAAELHARLERQTFEARHALARDAARAARLALAAAEERAREARAERDAAEKLRGEVARRREEAEEAFAAKSRDRERLQGHVFSARSAAERIAMRLERVSEQTRAAGERRERRLRQLELLEAEARKEAAADGAPMSEERLPRPPEEAVPGATTQAAWDALPPADRIRSLEREVRRLESDREARLREEIAALDAERAEAAAAHERLEAVAAERRAALDRAEREVERAREERREAERATEAARARAAQAGSELAAVNQFLRGAAAAPDGTATLAGSLEVDPGYELALAAALGPRLSAALVDDLPAGERWLDRLAERGGTALVRSRGGGERRPATPPPGAEPLSDHVRTGELSRRAGRAPAGRRMGGRLPVQSPGDLRRRGGHAFRPPARRRHRGALAGPRGGRRARARGTQAPRRADRRLAGRRRRRGRGAGRVEAGRRRRRDGGHEPRGGRGRAAARRARRRGGGGDRVAGGMGHGPPPRGAGRGPGRGAQSRAARPPARRASPVRAHRG